MTEENTSQEKEAEAPAPRQDLPPFTLTSQLDNNGVQILVVVRPPQGSVGAVTVPVVNSLLYTDPRVALQEVDALRASLLQNTIDLAFRQGMEHQAREMANVAKAEIQTTDQG